MILLLLAAASAEPMTDNDARFASCIAQTERDPAKAIAEASAWRMAGGGVLARQCIGLAFAAQKNWQAAMEVFVQAAEEAERNRDARSARLWVQAGNAALAGGQAEKGRTYFDAAIVGGLLQGEELGEAHLDRARALNALRQQKFVRADLDMAIKLVPADPLAWLLSATLARREGDLKRAETDIGEALKRAPDDAQVALEAGNIALMRGAPEAARVAWEGAVKLSPDSPAGKSAAAALAQLGAANTP